MECSFATTKGCAINTPSWVAWNAWRGRGLQVAVARSAGIPWKCGLASDEKWQAGQCPLDPLSTWLSLDEERPLVSCNKRSAFVEGQRMDICVVGEFARERADGSGDFSLMWWRRDARGSAFPRTSGLSQPVRQRDPTAPFGHGSVPTCLTEPRPEEAVVAVWLRQATSRGLKAWAGHSEWASRGRASH
jgi:hypothetical protein